MNFVNWLRNRPSGDASQIKHPSSQHMVYNYANYVHQHGTYSFSDLGEYTLDISACQSSGTELADSAAPAPQEHELFVWPDALRFKGLLATDVQILGKLFLKDSMIDKDKLITLLNPSAVIQTMTEPSVMFGVCNQHALENAQRVQQWFEQAISAKYPGRKINYFIASVNKRRTERIAKVLAFPLNKQFEEVNSLRKVEQIVDELMR